MLLIVTLDARQRLVPAVKRKGSQRMVEPVHIHSRDIGFFTQMLGVAIGTVRTGQLSVKSLLAVQVRPNGFVTGEAQAGLTLA